jgi:hypothetical protein
MEVVWLYTSPGPSPGADAFCNQPAWGLQKEKSADQYIFSIRISALHRDRESIPGSLPRNNLDPHPGLSTAPFRNMHFLLPNSIGYL